MTPDRRQLEVQKLDAQQLEKQFDVVGSSSAQVLVKDALPQPLLLQAQYADVSVKMVNPVESKPIASLQNTILSSNPQQSHGKPKALVPSLDLDKLNTSHTSVSQTPSAIHDADGGCNSKITYALSARNIPPPQSPSPALSSPPPLPTAAPVELASAAVPALQQPRTPARPPSSHSSPPPVVVNTISPNASLEKSATKSSGKKPSMRASSSLSDDEDLYQVRDISFHSSIDDASCFSLSDSRISFGGSSSALARSPTLDEARRPTRRHLYEKGTRLRSDETFDATEFARSRPVLAVASDYLDGMSSPSSRSPTVARGRDKKGPITTSVSPLPFSTGKTSISSTSPRLSHVNSTRERLRDSRRRISMTDSLVRFSCDFDSDGACKYD